jgi:hypothetical protein
MALPDTLASAGCTPLVCPSASLRSTSIFAPGHKAKSGANKGYSFDGRVRRTLVANGAANAMPTQGLKWRATPDDDEHYVYAIAL